MATEEEEKAIEKIKILRNRYKKRNVEGVSKAEGDRDQEKDRDKDDEDAKET